MVPGTAIHSLAIGVVDGALIVNIGSYFSHGPSKCHVHPESILKIEDDADTRWPERVTQRHHE
jgi:hypothetical protein